MKKKIMFLLLLISVCFQSCNEPSQEVNVLSTNSEDVIIDPVLNFCYEINEGKAFNNALVLNKEFSGKVALRTEIDTSNLKLVNVRIIKTYLINHRDSSTFAEFQNTDFDKKPEYPKELLDILPLIEQYFETIKVTKINQKKDCSIPNSYSMLLKIE